MASFFGSRDNFGPADDDQAAGKNTKGGVRVTPELNAFLGKGCSYEGKLTFEGRVRIDGVFKGEIFSNDTLEIGKDAQVEAEIDVATLVIGGRVTGTVHARKRCELQAPARVQGSITTPSLVIAEGVVFDGTTSMSNARKGEGKAATKDAPAAKPKGNGRPARPNPA
jgi:cytoskeletal protein CcmA (bactofilin family)